MVNNLCMQKGHKIKLIKHYFISFFIILCSKIICMLMIANNISVRLVGFNVLINVIFIVLLLKNYVLTEIILGEKKAENSCLQ